MRMTLRKIRRMVPFGYHWKNIWETLLLFMIIYLPSFSQNLYYRGFLESGILAGTNGSLPFWMISNKYGRFSPKNFNSYLDGGFLIDSINTGKKNLKLNGGLEGFLRWDGTWKTWIQQGYAGVTWGKFSAFAGNKEEHFGMQDPDLSSGFVIWSANARTLPKVSIGVTNWTEVPFTKHFVHFKGGLAHGWFGNDGYVKNVYFHQKYVYFRIGGDKKYHINLGFHHIAQWAGVSPEYGKLPSSLGDFIKVCFALESDSADSKLPYTESHNRIGNHLGTRDISFDYLFKNGTKILLYWQNFIEDITGLGFRNAMDGLWGLQISLKQKIGINYEYVNTVTDPSLPIVNGDIWGLDDYFNNAIYKSYTYKKYTLGNPFITSPIIFTDENTPYNISNNRICAHYVALKYISLNSAFLLKYSYSKNYGGRHLLFSPPLVQHSIYCSIEKNINWINRIICKIGIGIDSGEFYGNRIGLGISILYYII